MINGLNIEEIHAVVFDLDGTVYCGDTVVDGAIELISYLRDKEIKIFFCTNNSTKTRQEICAKLNAMNFGVLCKQIYSAAYSAAHYIAMFPDAHVYCFGTKSLKEELRNFDINIVSEPEDASIILIGLDINIDYKSISKLLSLRNKNCRYIACNRDKYVPSNDGTFQLACGFIVSIVEIALEIDIDFTIGKPNPYMINLLASENRLAMNEIIMIGDSIESDIVMAQSAGCQAIYFSPLKIDLNVFKISSLNELIGLL